MKHHATGGRLLRIAAPSGGTLTWLTQWGNPIGCSTVGAVESVQLTSLDGVNWYASYVPEVIFAAAADLTNNDNSSSTSYAALAHAVSATRVGWDEGKGECQVAAERPFG